MKFGIESEMKDVDSEPFSFAPRTEFGKKLLTIRNEIIAGGEPLLDWEAIDEEVANRRGGYSNESV